MATPPQSGPFETNLAEFGARMQQAAAAASRGDAQGTVDEFTLACQHLQKAELAAPDDEAMLVSTLATQCKVVLAEFAAGEMESAIAILDDLAWVATRLGPLDDEPDVNRRWMRCAVNLTILQTEKCQSRCTHEHYRPLLNAVAERCGGSDVQPRGGYLLTRIWSDATR